MKVDFNTSEDVVNKQLIAYNEGDFETFISYYHPNITSFDLETAKQNPSMSGMNFFAHYRRKFLEHPKIHCQIVKRVVHHDLVIDQEVISKSDNQKHSELVIYQVKEGRISKMWFSKIVNL